MDINFIKLTVSSDDVLVVDHIERSLDALVDYASLARRILPRHTGAGARTLVVLTKAQNQQIRLRSWDKHGSERTFCASGIVASSKYLIDAGKIDAHDIKLLIGTELIKVDCVDSDSFSVNLGKPYSGLSISVSGEEKKNADLDTARTSIVLAGKKYYFRLLNLFGSWAVFTLEANAKKELTLFTETLRSQEYLHDTQGLSVQAISRDILKLSYNKSCEIDPLIASACALVSSYLDGFSEREAAVKNSADSIYCIWSTRTNEVSAIASASYIYRGEYHFFET